MATDASLGDILAGAAGRPVNRVALNATIQQGQAMAGLRTAQTEDALLKAAEMRDQQGANDRLEDSLFNVLTATGDPNARQHAKYGRDVMVGGHGNALQAEQAFGDILKNVNTQTLSDPNRLGSAAQTAAQQGIQGKVATPFSVPETYGVLPGQTAPDVHQTPQGEAHTADVQSQAHLRNVQADAGGFNPHSGAQGGMSHLPQEQQDALNQAMADGRLNPRDLNSRNVDIYGHMAVNNPNFNFNRAAADAALSRNSTFQQKAMVVEALPGLVSHVSQLGSKLNYSDAKVVGEAKKWFLGQTNDPDLTEYMTARNDTLMKIANVMRGVGMSDKAHEAEIEAMSPTLSPAALNAWMKGQMSAITPLIEQQRRASHIGEPGANGGPSVPTGTGQTPKGPDPSDPLGLRSK